VVNKVHFKSSINYLALKSNTHFQEFIVLFLLLFTGSRNYLILLNVNNYIMMNWAKYRKR